MNIIPRPAKLLKNTLSMILKYVVIYFFTIVDIFHKIHLFFSQCPTFSDKNIPPRRKSIKNEKLKHIRLEKKEKMEYISGM